MDLQRPNKKSSQRNDDKTAVGSLDDICQHLRRLLADGLEHGFFEARITIEIIHHERRAVLISAGKCHRFILPETFADARPTANSC
jgi:hypothetical protein